MKLSVIIPAHNEESNITNALEKISAYLNKKHFDYEIIVSEDGSNDNTLQIANEFAINNKRVSVIHSTKRLGKGGGILNGFKHSHGDIAAFIDADLSSGPNELGKVIEAVKSGNDVAIASRSMRQSKIIKDRPLVRKIAAKGMNFLVNRMFDLSISDTQCGLKAFKRETLQKILPKITKKGFEFDVELLLLAKGAGMKIKEVPIVWEHKQETAKISSLPFSPALKISLGLFNLWSKKSFNKYDMFFFLFLAFFVAFASMFLGKSIGADEGTHLAITAFFYNFIHDYLRNPTISFSKIYNYTIYYLVRYPKLSLYYPPGFYVTAALISYIFGLTDVVAAATGLIFGVLTILCVYYFGRKFIDRKTGIIAAIIFSLIPIVFDLSVRAMLDLSYLMFFMLSLIFYLFAFHTGKAKHFIYAALLFAIGFMFKQNILILGPIIFIYALITSRKHILPVLLSFLIVAILIAPYMIFAYKSGLLAVMLKSSLRVTGYDLSSPQFTTIRGWLYYPQQLAMNYLSYPVLIAAVVSLAYYSFKKEKYWKLLLIWFFSIYLLFTVIPNKTGRYLLPAIPALLFPLSYYISKLPKVISITTLAASLVLILYTSYLILLPNFYYTTNYGAIAATTLKKDGNVLLLDEQESWFYSSAFIFEFMRQDTNVSHSVVRPCDLNVFNPENVTSFINANGIRYVISTNSTTSPLSDSLPVLHLVKIFNDKNTTMYVYENMKYTLEKKNCNYICITNQWICANVSTPTDALR